MCAALGIQHTMPMRHIVIFWSARLYNIFPHYLINFPSVCSQVTIQETLNEFS